MARDERFPVAPPKNWTSLRFVCAMEILDVDVQTESAMCTLHIGFPPKDGNPPRLVNEVVLMHYHVLDVLAEHLPRILEEMRNRGAAPKEVLEAKK